MKALVTAGGRGIRMQNALGTLNKHLLPIADRPMLLYVLDEIKTAGITKVGIAINPGDQEIRRVVDNWKRSGIDVTYIEAGPSLELPEIIKRSQDFLGSEPFVFYLGDNLLQHGIHQFIRDFLQRGIPDAYLVLAKTDRLERYGVAIIDRDRITDVIEKPEAVLGQFAVTGVSIYSRRLLLAIQQIEEDCFKDMTISDMHQYLIDNDFRVVYSVATGWWKDIGTPEDYATTERLFAETGMGSRPAVFSTSSEKEGTSARSESTAAWYCVRRRSQTL